MADTYGTPDIGFGLYVHWPFCLAKCPYCDFNSHVRHGGVDDMAYAAALVREMAWFAGRTPKRTLTSVFFGGGTPSLMPPEAVASIIDEATRHWRLDDAIDITLEANPTSAEAGNFKGYRTAGVNRVSLGVQALNDNDLAALGRQHTVKEALAAHRMAASIFPQTSFDLIYARPAQTVAAWRDELNSALTEQNGHMSLYQLTIEQDTPFAALHARGRLHIPPEDTAADLYEVTQELTERAGLEAYEVSNHAAPARQSRHNLLYWRYGEYAGIGPGAHSRLVAPDGARIALNTEKSPERWRQQVEAHGHGIIEETKLSGIDAAREFVLMGLRLAEGIDPVDYAALAGQPLSGERIEVLHKDGLIEQGSNGRLAATPAGRLVLNAVISQLLA